MKRFVAVALLALAACDGSPPQTGRAPDDPQVVEQGQYVVLIAVAPDGTKLWRYNGPGTSRYVFFSAAGTSTTERCGKNCSRAVQVPNTP